MKKSLIAASASAVALAAMPIVGVFAADVTSHTDRISITLAPVCTLGTVSGGAATSATDETGHTGHLTTPSDNNIIGTWTEGTGGDAASGTDGRTDTLAATLVNSQTVADLGETTLNIRCTKSNGFTLSAVAGTVEDTNNDNTADSARLTNGSYYIESAAPASFDATSTASYWNFYLNATTKSEGITIASGYNAAHAVPAVETPIATTAASGDLTNGEHVTVVYGAGINNTQASGTYTGTVVYTLAQNS